VIVWFAVLSKLQAVCILDILICCFVLSAPKYPHNTFPLHQLVLQNNCQSVVLGAVVVSKNIDLFVNVLLLASQLLSTKKGAFVFTAHQTANLQSPHSLNHILFVVHTTICQSILAQVQFKIQSAVTLKGAVALFVHHIARTQSDHSLNQNLFVLHTTI
jgi:hypothetical protein